MMTFTNTLKPIQLTRWYDHSQKKVFDAFAKASLLEKWIAPSDTIITKVLKHDFNVGGQYRIAFTLPDGTQRYLGGDYLLIQEPKRICFTWQWETPDEHAHISSLVSIDISTENNKTKLQITHENLSTIEAKQRHEQGWHGATERLSTLMS